MTKQCPRCKGVIHKRDFIDEESYVVCGSCGFTETERESFIRHLEATSERVRQWPEWKKGIWGPALPEEMHQQKGGE